MKISFQQRVKPWMDACFGESIANDTVERNHRFLEESLELVQACGCTADEAHQLVEYVFNRPTGEKHQEVGGVMVTLAALCLAHSLNMHKDGDTELKRIWQKIEAIRAKQATKPKHSPLPCGDHTRGFAHAPGMYQILRKGEVQLSKVTNLKQLQPGTLVRLRSRSEVYVVTANYGSRVTAARSIDITNPPEWLCLEVPDEPQPPENKDVKEWLVIPAFLRRNSNE